MDILKYCEIHLDDNNPPCLLADYKTDKILFLNTTMKELLGNKTDIVGRKFYEVMTSRKSSKIKMVRDSWNFNDVTEAQIYSDELSMRFRVKHMPFEINGEKYNLCKYISLTSHDGKNLTFEEAVTQCIGIIQNRENNPIPELLELLGLYYDAEQTYYYYWDKDLNQIICDNKWGHAAQDNSVVNVGEHIETSMMRQWLKTRNETGIIDEDNSLKNYSSDSIGGQMLEFFGFDNVVLNSIENTNKHVMAAIALCNRRETSIDYQFLQVVSKFIENIVTQAEMKEAIEEINQKDILTGFYRHANYMNQIELFQNNPPNSIGVLYVNVNGMKQVNIDYGYAKGDSRIQQSAKILKNYFHGEFYRVSGDEFVAFFPSIGEEEFENKITELQNILTDDNRDLFAIGHAWTSGEYNLAKLILEADKRMYINKQTFYAHAQKSLSSIKDSTLNTLFQQLENQEFIVYMQPQISLKDGRVCGAEALIRRYDRDSNIMILPNQFIEDYERKSLIRHVDIFVINEVCRILNQWGNVEEQIPISVNLSRVTLLEYGIVDTIANICDQYGIPHNKLIIEVTERMGLTENNVESRLIREFKEHGFEISLDDFGCAYSNIMTLIQLSVDELKIDKSLITEITTNKKNAAVVKSVLSMCKDLGDITTVSEGIETQEQVDLLNEFECNLGQGYWYSKPIPTEEFYEKYIE